ncbi:hypothetical protein TrLO_g1369 [Triparma laevis f. longispina]|uniref:Protein kinase domain-containing protein n=1 Tax=Triparma laevis f. longispina TaxID=1714387 RepID=A0A9W7FTW3_9STRA|nr:hypothetical protein TrLO_g1369 [Triparma laevis f. longispina]
MSNPPISSSNLHKIALLERRLSTPGPGSSNSNGAISSIPETGFAMKANSNTNSNTNANTNSNAHSPKLKNSNPSSYPRSESSTLIPSPSNSSSLHSNPSNPGQSHGPGFSHDTSSNPIYDSVASPDSQVKKRKMKEPVKKEIKKVKKVSAASALKKPAAAALSSSSSNPLSSSPPSINKFFKNENSHGNKPSGVSPSPDSSKVKDRELEDLRRDLAECRKEKETVLATLTARSNLLQTSLEEHVRKATILENEKQQSKIDENSRSLGRITSSSTWGSGVGWEDGFRIKLLLEKKESLKELKGVLEKRQKDLKKQIKRYNTSMPPPGDNKLEGGLMEVNDDLGVREGEESVRYLLSEVKRREAEVNAEAELLEQEKLLHSHDLRLRGYQTSSRFSHLPTLHNRYVLMQLIGRGGFSEVWKSYDLIGCRPVAVKIHQLDSRWSEDKKRSYTRHVSREYDIHRTVTHGRIVSLLDVFEIDHDSFATVLEYCDGGDLDQRLKERKLNERDARAIIIQVVSGVKYLNAKGVIHYDLKPGNILFDRTGDCRITDFGLSKMTAGEEDIEMTSIGAGTYWYLPPECFRAGGGRISGKVDVWSLGVIYYQMLYGKRPFGEGLTQDKIYQNNVISNAQAVEFPDTVKVSNEGKEWMRRCLEREVGRRWTVEEAGNSEYFKLKKL